MAPLIQFRWISADPYEDSYIDFSRYNEDMDNRTAECVVLQYRIGDGKWQTVEFEE